MSLSSDASPPRSVHQSCLVVTHVVEEEHEVAWEPNFNSKDVVIERRQGLHNHLTHTLNISINTICIVKATAFMALIVTPISWYKSKLVFS